MALRIVETEAYGGPEEAGTPIRAPHSYRGPTPSAAVMFGPAGHAYVYRSYGIHLCVNITCESDGEGGAVLLRSAEVPPAMMVVAARRRSRRGAVRPRSDGRWAPATPGRRRESGSRLGPRCARSALRPAAASRGGVECTQVRSGPRVGLTVATGRPWRFWIDGHPAVSTWRPGSAAVRARRSATQGDAEGSDW